MKKWSLNLKVYLMLSVLVVAAFVIAFMGLAKMTEIKDSLNSIVYGSAARVGNAHEIKELFLIQIINDKNLILETDKSRQEVHAKRLDERHRQILELREKAMGVSTEAGKKNWDDFQNLYLQWWDLENSIRSLVETGKNNEAFEISRTKGREFRLKVEELTDGIVKRNEDFMLADTKEAESDYAAARNLMVVVSLSATIFGFLLAFIILKAVMSGIDSVISTLSIGAREVHSASSMVATASEELSQSSTEGASSLEETAASIEQMNSMIQKNSENARRTAALAHSSSKSAEKGKSVVKDMVHAIDNINSSNEAIRVQIDDSNDKIGDIVRVISEIGNKTKVINDIVFQTKLLSFNASIEAARAGEHGKGFAVVAEEVGNLAEMSGQAAQDISHLLDGSIKKVTSIVEDTKSRVAGLMVDSKNKIEEGTRVVGECDMVLDEILESVSSVNQMANEISTACVEQAQGVNEITKAISQLDQTTQTNASTSEEVASSAEELSAQSQSLKNAVEVLVKTVKGDNGQTEQQQFTTSHSSNTTKKSNVVQFKAKAVVPKIHGDYSSVPSESDPRFKEI